MTDDSSAPKPQVFRTRSTNESLAGIPPRVGHRGSALVLLLFGPPCTSGGRDRGKESLQSALHGLPHVWQGCEGRPRSQRRHTAADPVQWLLKFIRSFARGHLVGRRDRSGVVPTIQATADARLDSPLGSAQISAILDWFAVDGPEQKEPDERNADVATPADIEWARSLFHGKERLASGGAACSSCHSVKGWGRRRRRILGAEPDHDLSQVPGQGVDLVSQEALLPARTRVVPGSLPDAPGVVCHKGLSSQSRHVRSQLRSPR